MCLKTVNADNFHTLERGRELLMKFDLNSQTDTVNHIVHTQSFSEILISRSLSHIMCVCVLDITYVFLCFAKK